ncbi:MAG TPA: acyltransferase [Galbitalea sp.]
MKRLTELDGIRGIAALVVVFFHLSLISQPFLDTHTVGDAWWWVSKTPLRLATDGTQAVLLFFVLSGLVVALPALRPGFSWRKFYASRALRLYVPAWGALALASILIFLIPRNSANVTSGTWLNSTNAHSTPIWDLLADASLMKVGNAVDNVLWSLRWEIIFSLLLPVFVLAALLIRRWWLASVIAVAACVALTIGSPNHADARFYLPVFFIGTVMAANLEALQAWSKRRGNVFWAIAFTASLAFMIAGQLSHPGVPANSLLGGLLWSLVALGAAGIILCGMGFAPLRRGLNKAVTQFLGRISFSLYLVHVPILATLAFVLGDAQWWLVAIIGLPVAIGAATLFHRWVEVPSQKLAHRVGRRVAGTRADVPAQAAPPAPVPALEPATSTGPIELVADEPSRRELAEAGMRQYYVSMR